MHDRPDLRDTHPNLKEFVPFLDGLNKESERGAVLISVSYLESQLKSIIAAYLCPGKAAKILLDDFNGPLGTFGARSHAAAALGLVTDQEYRELQMLGKIRNEFAHRHRTTFSDQSIIDRCRNLTFSAKDYDDVVVGARAQFTTAAVSLILNFTNRPHYVFPEAPGVRRLAVLAPTTPPPSLHPQSSGAKRRDTVPAAVGARNAARAVVVTPCERTAAGSAIAIGNTDGGGEENERSANLRAR